MDGVKDLIFLGAEAEVTRDRFLGLPAVAKRRVAKAYRHPDLDRRIRRERTRLEALILADAAAAGLPVPRVLDVDQAQARLLLEAILGPSLREHLETEPADAVRWCREFGRLTGRLHAAGIVHGDLTTSNVLVSPAGLVLLDFGLADRSGELEDRGVDLHLVERTFASSHPDHPEYHAEVVAGYSEAFPGAPAVLARVHEIKARGRYV